MTSEENKQLQLMAVKVREGIVTATHGAKSGHPGGSLSAADMYTYLYFKEMRVDPKNPKWADRDRFVLSKGHTCPGLYSALANRGFFPVEDLPTLRHIDSYLQGHPNMNTVPGVDMSTGSLGQGLSAACGMAKGAKFLNKDINVYSLLGDGELAEGQIWEATGLAQANMCLRLLAAAGGTVCMGVGLGLYVSVGCGLGAMEGIVMYCRERFHISVGVSKIIQDVTLVLPGILLGARWGVGTVIAMFCTGPVLQFSTAFFKGRVFSALHRPEAEHA